MTNEQRENVLADCLEEFHARRARGERADLGDFAARLGPAYPEFQELIATETLLDEALEPLAERELPTAWGAYTLLREVGRGAAGVVYEAVHRTLGRKVALKVLRAGIDTDDHARQRFLREAQALAQVRHAHIVEIYEYGEVDGRPYYAMEFVAGPSLADLLRRDERPTPSELCLGLAGVCRALHTLHEAGIIHRDVKPSNVMIRGDGRYVLADFGLARTAMAATVTRTGDTLGTPLYMSPEQMLGRRDGIDRRTDVYGTGATLYQMLCGQPPFRTDNLHALMRMILTQRPEPARAVHPGVPADCSAIAMKCLEKEPTDRYASAAALEEDLRRFALGARVSGRPVGRVRRGGRWIRRRPMLSAAAVVLVALGGYWTFNNLRSASMTLHSYPPNLSAEASVDGGAWMTVPLQGHALQPHREHEVRMRARVEGFGEFVDRVTPSAGQEFDWIKEVPVADPDHPEVRRVFFELAQVKLVDGVSSPPRHRGLGDDKVVTVEFPRGTVRVRDLSTWHLRVGTSFPDEHPKGGWIEFRVDDRVLGEGVAFPRAMFLDNSGEIPDTVKAALRPGDVVRWGFRPEGGTDFVESANLLVVEADLDAGLTRIDERTQQLGSAGVRTSLRGVLRIAHLLEHDLAWAAWNEAQALVEQDADTLYVLHLQRVALETMYSSHTPAGRRALESSSAWEGLLARWDAKPQEARDRFVRAHAPR